MSHFQGEHGDHQSKTLQHNSSSIFHLSEVDSVLQSQPLSRSINQLVWKPSLGGFRLSLDVSCKLRVRGTERPQCSVRLKIEK